jgi:hypothetical protein
MYQTSEEGTRKIRYDELRKMSVEEVEGIARRTKDITLLMEVVSDFQMNISHAIEKNRRERGLRNFSLSVTSYDVCCDGEVMGSSGRSYWVEDPNEILPDIATEVGKYLMNDGFDCIDVLLKEIFEEEKAKILARGNFHSSSHTWLTYDEELGKRI